MCTVQTVWAATLWLTSPSLAALQVLLPASTLHECNAKKSDAASGKKRWKPWKKNLIFALVVLALAAALLWSGARARAARARLAGSRRFRRRHHRDLPLDKDHDYLYDVGSYVVHLQVKDGAIAFLDSQCPDHVCEQFGWLDKDGAWAACVPQGCMWSAVCPEHRCHAAELPERLAGHPELSGIKFA